jgi:GDP-mannose 6-dehydrogenase
MRINVYGLGYVGSVSAACLAADGHDVLGIDVDHGKVATINKGLSSVVEAGLPELIHAGMQSGRLRAATEPSGASDVSLVCVGTPSRDNGSLCLDYVSRVTTGLGAYLKRLSSYHVVCVRSTVLPGTVEGLVIRTLEDESGKKAGRDFGVCMNPEFLREGSSIRDYRCPPFTLIGELDERSGDVIAGIYSNVAAPVIRTRLEVAEMVKYAGNAFHAMKITFANEVGIICKRLGLDGREVMDIVCRDEKLNISKAYLQPGFAFGGSCLPKDLRALLHKAKELDLEPQVLRSILQSNNQQVDEAYHIIRKTGKKRIAVLGLSFKPGTDDLRESPIATLVEMLVGKGYRVTIYDREVSLARLHGANKNYIEHFIPHISCLMKPTLETTLDGAEVVVVAKRSAEFDAVLETIDGTRCVIDLVRIPDELRKQKGLEYEGICW